MSYDIKLLDPVTKEVIELDTAHFVRGGTYAVGGTCELWLNVTWNYSHFFHETIDKEKGIRAIYGLTGAQSIPVLNRAIISLPDDVDKDYWKATGGNAKRALLQLREFARMRPDGIWAGD